MIVKEFISKIADGTFTKNDVIEYAALKKDKLDLIWNLWFADKVVIESTGKPQINDDIQMNRIHNAISLISQEFNVSLLDYNAKRKFMLSKELYNERAQRLFDKAIDIGLIIVEGENLKWTKRKVLLAYFLRSVYITQNSSNTQLPERELGLLFKEARLSKAVTQLSDNKTGKPKIDSEIIDRIIEEYNKEIAQ